MHGQLDHGRRMALVRVLTDNLGGIEKCSRHCVVRVRGSAVRMDEAAGCGRRRRGPSGRSRAGAVNQPELGSQLEARSLDPASGLDKTDALDLVPESPEMLP